MTETASPIGVAVLATGRAELLEASLGAHADALDRLEAAGVATMSVVVDRAGRPDATAVLARLDGTTILPSRDGEGEAAALLRAVDALPAESRRVVLTTTAAAPAPAAIEALVAASVATDADLTLADATEPAPYAVLHRRALDALREVAADDGADPPVLATARLLRSSGRTVTTAPGAGQALGDTRVAVAGTDRRGAQLEAAHPEAVSIGYASYFGPRSVVATWAPLERIRIGGYCSAAGDVRILHPGGRLVEAGGGAPIDTSRVRGAHRMASTSTFPIGILVPDEPYDEIPLDGSVHSRPLEIGSDVWIGTGATILGAVSIGHGAVIGAGAVIRRDVGPYEVVVGNPAQVTRRRFDDRVCDRLLAVRWWDWDPAVVRGNHELFADPVVDFLARFDPAGALD